MACDLGSENVSALYAVMYLFLCNVDLFGDCSHACNRDTVNAMGMASLKQFWQVMLISFKLPYGPNNDDANANLLDEVMEHLGRTYSHANLPALFLASAPKMLEVLGRAGIEFPGLIAP